MTWQISACILSAIVVLSQSQCITNNDEFPVEKNFTDTSGINEFGLDLFKTLFPYNTSQNFFFSPYSIWSALTLAYFGASGMTELQLQKVLGHEDKDSAIRLWKTMEFVYEIRQTNNSDYTFALANRAYFDGGVNVRDCMKTMLSNEIETLNMTSEPLKSSITINEWVSNITKNRIPKLVEASDLINAKIALVNAAFFKGTWLYQFKPQNTKKEIFYTSQDDFSFVDMMTQKGNFRFGSSEELGAQVLELPYNGESVSMYILLPPFISGANGFDAMVGKLNETSLKNALLDTWRVQLEVTIPKFKLQQEIGNELIESLSTMGITDLFDQDLADLTTFSSDGGLSVGKSIHKAFVEVNEEGSEAAAATAFITFRVARPVGPSKFVCNHPFMFVIYDNEYDNILFMGAYKNPKAY